MHKTLQRINVNLKAGPTLNFKVSKFWAIYLTVVFVVVFAVVIWLINLNKMMAAYEASMPQHLAQATAQSLERGEYKALYRMLDAQAQGESEAQFSNYLSGKIMDQPISYEALHSPSQDEKRYALSADGTPFAQLTLGATQEADAYGNRRWAVKGVSLPNAPTAEYLLTAPDEYTVFIDDNQADESLIVERDIPMDCAGHLPESKVHIPTWTKYRIVRSFSQPKFRVLDRSGKEVALEEVGEGEYKADLQYDAAVRKSQGKRAVEIAKAYGLFSIGRKSKTSFLKDILPGTDAYDMIYKYDERWFVKNSGYKFTNVKAEKFYAYSKNCYSCEVTYDLVLKAANGKREVYPTKLTLYMYKTDSFKVYDMVIGQ